LNLLIVIPCYNHHQSSSKLISLISTEYKILLIDDGSSGKYIFNTQENLYIHNNPTNLGKGKCIKFAAKYAIKNNFTHILVIDADLQHDPKFIPDFINKSENKLLVYGKRDFNNNMPLLRKLSNTITSFMLSKICNVDIYDTQCGYRLYDLSIFDKLKSKENGYIFESEILLKTINNKKQIDYVNINTIYNKSTSSINKIKDTLNFIKLILTNINLYAYNR